MPAFLSEQANNSSIGSDIYTAVSIATRSNAE